MSKSVLRALQVIASLAEEPASATRVAAATGVSLSTAVRLLQELDREGFATRDATGRYHIGTRLLSIAYRVIASMDVRQAAVPILQALSRETGETVHLGYFDRSTAIYIDKFDGAGALSMRSRVGLAAPLHCTAMGKIMCAFLPDAQRQQLARDLDYPRHTDSTIGDPESFLRELDHVRKVGYAFNFGEHEAEISAVALPIRHPSGVVEYGIDLAVPNFQVSNDQLRALLPRVIKAAHDVETKLGYR